MGGPLLVSAFFAILALATLNGCHISRPTTCIDPPYTAYRSPNTLFESPRRILVMPVSATVFDGGFSLRWYHLLTAELRSVKKFEVVTASPDVESVRQCLAEVKRGLYSERSLALVKADYRVDGVMFIRVDDFDPYWPPRMAVNVNVVETSQGATILSVDGNWDARDERVQMLVRDYAQYVTTANEYSDPELITQSPEYFGKFVAHQIATAICALCRDEYQSPSSATSEDKQTQGVSVVAGGVSPEAVSPDPGVEQPVAAETQDLDAGDPQMVPSPEELPVPASSDPS